MANLDVLTYGFSFISPEGGFGWSSISLLEVGGQNIVIDTGPASRRNNLWSALDSRGLTPEEIDLVILTHMHWDHCQNTDMFSNARILVHPKEIDYAHNPNPADHNAAKYIADMMDKMRVEPISDGDVVADGISIIDTPGHTLGHISVVADVGEENILVAGDAMPDGGTVTRRLPYNVFWDVNDATESVEKILDSSDVFYPGHDRPFRLSDGQVEYLHGPTQVEIVVSNEGNTVAPSLAYTVHSVREPNIQLVQKP